MKTPFRQRALAWLRLVPGAAVGLFLARVVLEVTQRPWPWPVVVLVGLLAALGGLAVGRRLTGSGVRLWPALLLLPYVLWPWRDPMVAASVAVLAALVWLLRGERLSLPGWAERLVDGATFLVALVAYVATAAPDVLPADAGEFQLVGALLGVAHPFGFPLYTMLGHLFIRLVPWGTPAYRLNLMSAVVSAGTLVLVARAIRMWALQLRASATVAFAGGLAAALALGTATTFWAQATIANIRTPTVFFASLALYALSRFSTAAEPREADRALALLGLALGLGVGHHLSLGFLGLVFVVYVLLTDRRLVVQPRRWWRPVLVGLAGLVLPLIYLPVRGAMGAPLAPENLDTLSGFFHHILARGFAGDMFFFANAADLPHRLALLPTLFLFQFNGVLLAAALLGLLGLLWRDWRLFVLLAGGLALHTFVSITYRAPQTVEYLMPAYLPVAAAVGLLPPVFCIRRPTSDVSSPRSLVCSLLVSAVLWGGLLNGWVHGPSFLELAGDHTAREVAQPLLETAPEGALILADWRWATPLWYLQQVEGLRPDVQVDYVYPVGDEYRRMWLRRIEETPPGRPLLLTHFYQFSGYTVEPWESGFLIRPRPVAEPAARLAPAEVVFGDQVRLLGYGLAQGGFRPGQVVEFTLAWQPAGQLDRPPSFTLHLVDEEGHDRAQSDRWLGTDAAPGEVRFERLFLPLYPTLGPGRYRVTVGAYTTTEAGFETLLAGDGQAAVTLAWLEVESPVHAPFTLHRRSVPFDGGPGLVGVDLDRSVPGVLRVYLHWRGPVEAGWEARVRTAEGAEAALPLPSVAAGAYQTVALDVPDPGRGGPLLSLVDGQGQRKTGAGPWGWPVREVLLPAPVSGTRFVPLGDEIALVGAKAWPDGARQTMVVDATLVALRPLTSDDATSVRLVEREGPWFVQHDSQPVLGAVPTLKWIRGSRVLDRHLLPLPEDVTEGEVHATLVAYERFRMASLPPMDDRFEAIPLGVWVLP